MSVRWHMERLDELRDRIARETDARADRLLAEMNTFEEYSFRDQRLMWERWGYPDWSEVPTHKPWSNWEIRRIIFPQMIAELEAL